MGCSTCKSKNKSKSKSENISFEEVKENVGDSVNEERLSVDKTFLNGLTDNIPKNFFLRLITFSAVVIVLPLLSVYLILHIFGSLFFTKDGKINVALGWLINGVTFPFRKLKKLRSKIREKAKKREFDKNRDYSDDSELSSVDVFKKDEMEILNDIELVETAKSDNDNG